MSQKLQEVVTKLGLKQENILYMNIQRPFLERIISEDKKVEFRDVSVYWSKKLNNYDKKTQAFVSSKPIKYILFQNGMKNVGSPRVLIELKDVVEKWASDEEGKPVNIFVVREKRTDKDSYRYSIEEAKEKYARVIEEATFEGFGDDDEFIALELGKIVYREHI
ncbi:hypothetical protein [Capnocytophaga sp.]|uniref:hypothetical protein n=1 Tax=Capnocytophaga sp. TaxID=44737 RepID=UPI0026DC21E5|nr:hypothetical protein [Capnocytophaga sp.]